MKRIFFFILFFFIFTSSSFAENFTLDPEHTYILWHIQHLGFSTQAGKWYASGTLTLDPKKLENSKVTATIKIDNMITGLPELDKHLKSAEFFDVAHFPAATFVSNKVTVTGKKTAKVQGVVTIHGISKPITLYVKFNQSGISPITNKMTVGFSAKTDLNRSDFDMKTLLPILGDKVKIDIEAEAYQSK